MSRELSDFRYQTSMVCHLMSDICCLSTVYCQIVAKVQRMTSAEWRIMRRYTHEETTMDYTIRAMVEDDFPRVNRLLLEIHAYHVAGVPFFFRLPERAADVIPNDLIRGKLGDPEALVLVAEAGPAINAGRWAHVEARGVTEMWRGRGVGRALMERAEAWGRQRGCSAVHLEVWGFNAAALAFYERLGYGPVLVRMRKEL